MFELGYPFQRDIFRVGVAKEFNNSASATRPRDPWLKPNTQKSYKSTQIHYTGFKFIRENTTTKRDENYYCIFCIY